MNREEKKTRITLDYCRLCFHFHFVFPRFFIFSIFFFPFHYIIPWTAVMFLSLPLPLQFNRVEIVITATRIKCKAPTDNNKVESAQYRIRLEWKWIKKNDKRGRKKRKNNEPVVTKADNLCFTLSHFGTRTRCRK